MPCGGCGQARSQLVQSVRSFNVGGVASALRLAVAVNVDKLRGVDVYKKYGGKPPVVTATPYQRPTRTT